MPNVTISLGEKLLKYGRKYAKKNNKSLNALIREILQQTVMNSQTNWIEECFKLIDKVKPNSKGRKWKRKDLYDV